MEHFLYIYGTWRMGIQGRLLIKCMERGVRTEWQRREATRWENVWRAARMTYLLSIHPSPSEWILCIVEDINNTRGIPTLYLTSIHRSSGNSGWESFLASSSFLWWEDNALFLLFFPEFLTFLLSIAEISDQPKIVPIISKSVTIKKYVIYRKLACIIC